MFCLDGKIAAVIGASRGIGQAIAVGLASAGADMAIVARGSLEETEERILAKKVKCISIHADLFDLDSAKKIISEKISEEFHQLDIIVNNAGIQRRSPALEFSEKDWDDVLQINLKSVFILSQLAANMMKGSGKIINVASLLSFQGGITVPAYAASKGGVASLTKALANEWAPYGINVNAIAPGYIDTEMNETLIADPQRSRQILERIPAGRWGKPEDLVGLAVYLASEDSNYMNGQVIAVDGGWLGR